MAVTAIEHLELRRLSVPDPGGGPGHHVEVVDLLLDGVRLDHLVQRLHGEEPSGDHLGLAHSTMRARLHGERPWGDGPLTALYGCCCTDVDCDPLLARIEVGDTTVRWSGFVRGSMADDELPGIELLFSRADYEAAIERFEAEGSTGC